MDSRPIKTVDSQIKTLVKKELIERIGTKKTGGYFISKNLLTVNGKIEELKINTVNETDDTVNETDDTVNETDDTENETDDTVNKTDDTVNVTYDTVNVTYDTVNVTDDTVNETNNTVNETDVTVNETHETVTNAVIEEVKATVSDKVNQTVKARLVKVLLHLLQYPGLRSKELAEIFKVSEVSVRRDMQKIKKLAEFKGSHKTGGYYLTDFMQQKLEG